MTRGLAAAALLLIASAAQAVAPLPPARPADLGAPVESEQASRSNDAEIPRPRIDAAPASGGACFARLKQIGVKFEPASQPPAPLSGCHIDTPVRVSSVPAESGRVELPAEPLLDCSYALVFADFIARHAAPLGRQKMRATLTALDTGPGYECRGRNRVRGARVSAHGKGIALDVSGFMFDDGRKVEVGRLRDRASLDYFAGVRKGGCDWFSTILGPGSDGYHELHLHYDTETHGRRGDVHICH